MSRRDLLRASARQEYEHARYETDPEVVSLLIQHRVYNVSQGVRFQ
jgi:hypothetical protein